MILSRGLLLVFFCVVLGLSVRAQTAKDTAIEATDTESTETRVSTDSTASEKIVFHKVPDSLRMLPDSTVRSWKKDPDFAYANDPSYWKKETLQESPSDNWFFRLLRSKGTKYFIYLLLGSILLFAIVRILMDNNLLFYRRGRKGKAADEATSDIVPEDLDEGFGQAILAKNHRLAVRYLYIKTLRQLGDRGLVRYHLKTTNQEYIEQLRGSPMERSFRYLTGIYDRVWYGEFALNEDQFERIHTYFKDFYKSIGA